MKIIFVCAFFIATAIADNIDANQKNVPKILQSVNSAEIQPTIPDIQDQEDQLQQSPKPHYNLEESASLYVKYLSDYYKVYTSIDSLLEHYDNFKHGLRRINRFNRKSSNAVIDINSTTDLSPLKNKTKISKLDD